MQLVLKSTEICNVRYVLESCIKNDIPIYLIYEVKMVYAGFLMSTYLNLFRRKIKIKIVLE